MRIFLSHGGNNKALVRDLSRRLPPHIDAWLDEERLAWGDSLADQISGEITSSSAFLVIFLDSAALQRDWVVRELDWALSRERELGRGFVLPIVLEEDIDLPAELTSRLYLRLADQSDDSLNQLARQIERELFKLVGRAFEAATADDALPNPLELVPQLAKKVEEKGRIPDLIFGVARGGLAIASLLSHRLSPVGGSRTNAIPVVGLWPRPDFRNDYNPKSVPPPAELLLVADDVCRSGRMLSNAVVYVRSIAVGANVETAASYYFGGSWYEPDYWVRDENDRVPDAAGQIEPPVEA